MYTIIEISELLDVTVNVVYNAIHKLGIIRFMCKNRINYYNKNQVDSISDLVKLSSKIVKYYPLKTTETFYVYESKINRP